MRTRADEEEVGDGFLCLLRPRRSPEVLLTLRLGDGAPEYRDLRHRSADLRISDHDTGLLELDSRLGMVKLIHLTLFGSS